MEVEERGKKTEGVKSAWLGMAASVPLADGYHLIKKSHSSFKWNNKSASSEFKTRTERVLLHANTHTQTQTRQCSLKRDANTQSQTPQK